MQERNDERAVMSILRGGTYSQKLAAPLPRLALLRHGAVSDLSPLCEQKRTLARAATPDIKVSLGRHFSAVCTENLIRVDDVMESPKVAE
jgi:hypothetical protein